MNVLTDISDKTWTHFAYTSIKDTVDHLKYGSVEML